MTDDDSRDVCCVCGQVLPPSFHQPPTDEERVQLRRTCSALLAKLVAAVVGVPSLVLAAAYAIHLVAEWIAG